MTQSYSNQYNCVVGVSQLSITAIDHSKNQQFQRQLSNCQHEKSQIESVKSRLDSALKSNGSKEHQSRSHEYYNFCKKGRSALLIDLKQLRAHDSMNVSNSYINIMKSSAHPIHSIIMFLLQKKQVKYAAGALGIAITLFGAYKLYQHLTNHNQPPSILSSNYDSLDQDEKQKLSLITRASQKEHALYETLIEDALRDRVGTGKLGHMENVRDIHYKLILSLMKGNSYQGIVSITFWLQGLLDIHEFFPINYNGGGIKLLLVNDRRLDPKEVRYQNHQILIPKELMLERGRNSIQIIFQNLYCFIDSGLAAYFAIDDYQKYSLRQQVMYSVSGTPDVERFMPCLNCLNECQVRLEVIHPDTFQVFSNTSKSLQRLCSVNEYQKYPFLFDLSSSALNKSFKMNESTISSCSQLAESAVSVYSSVNYHNRKKANTHFYKERLPSIQHLFVLCSNMIELQPEAHSHLESDLLLRYFCKATEAHRLGKNINAAHKYILEAFRRLAAENIKEHVNKIDILIVGDREVEGLFAPGVILLSQDSLSGSTLDVRCLYLLVRALLGLLQLERGKNVVTLEEILGLNQAVFDRFEEFRNYLFIKNHKLQHLRKLATSPSKRDFIMTFETNFLKYFGKELRFLLRENSQERISFQLKNLMLSFRKETHEEFWENLLANSNFLPPLILEPLIKLALRELGVPSKSRLLVQLRECFSHSKYVLSFFTNDEISNDLPTFIQAQTYGLQERLTQIKVKQKFKDFITERYEKYLPIGSNLTEAETRYLEFKKFNESKNFHHISVLKGEINRVRYFGTKFIRNERVPAQCSIMGWKLLARLKLYPADQQCYALIREFQNLP